MKRMLQKWDPRRRTHLPYMIPGNWNVSIFEWDLAAAVNCAGCGQRLAFGDSYTSRQIHTPAGMGYAVCRRCYDREWREEQEAQVDRDQGNNAAEELRAVSVHPSHDERDL